MNCLGLGCCEHGGGPLLGAGRGQGAALAGDVSTTAGELAAAWTVETESPHSVPQYPHSAAALTWEVVQLAVVVVAEAGVGGGHQEAGGGAIRGRVPARVQLLPEPGDLEVAAEAGLAQHTQSQCPCYLLAAHHDGEVGGAGVEQQHGARLLPRPAQAGGGHLPGRQQGSGDSTVQYSTVQYSTV